VALRLTGNNIVNVESMKLSEARELLEASVGGKRSISDTESTERLLELLTNLPLAMKQAAAYMNTNQISATEYLEMYESSDQNMIDLSSKSFADGRCYESNQVPVAGTWLISFQHISDQDQLAANYLKFMSFLGEKDIPKSLLPSDEV
jgi:hypothetical protein